MSTVVILTGVCGSGKTTVGQELARKLGWPIADGDDFHSASNKHKMKLGIPLTDDDRTPWLQSLHEQICRWIEQGQHGIVACSALKYAYRQILRSGADSYQVAERSPATIPLHATQSSRTSTRLIFVLLHCSTEALSSRLQQRSGHFFNPALLQSQLDALEAPVDSEDCDVVVDSARPLSEIVDNIVSRL